MEFIQTFGAFSIFLAIAAAGFLFLTVSALFGGLFEHFDGLDDHGGPGFFSSRVIAVFITAFGGAGAVATYYGLTPLPASMVGFAMGLLFGGAIYLFAQFLVRQQASSDVSSNDLVGQLGRVVVAIPAGGVGQIRCRIGEELIDKIARTRDGGPVPEHMSVRIEEVLGETVIVRQN